MQGRTTKVMGVKAPKKETAVIRHERSEFHKHKNGGPTTGEEKGRKTCLGTPFCKSEKKASKKTIPGVYANGGWAGKKGLGLSGKAGEHGGKGKLGRGRGPHPKKGGQA